RRGSKIDDDRKPRRLSRYHWERAGKMETGDARDGRSQSAVHYGGCVDRWGSDGETISARAVQGSEDLEIFRERKGRAQRGTQRHVSRRSREHRACRACRRPAIKQASRLSDGPCEESAERYRSGTQIFRVG